ncbi:UDP-glucose/GDP-mannose dehydrogenase family protein [Haliea sp.]|jgi:UDPglucose 6-dehydrogenase|uniref:UDP-glucose dehydrogenase family protein n=1 Tax=Haliea TaxID=475794 RepID=UPI000C43F9A3|nr:UDP-glucose/GDP-mannose dehydrogenase family protein [Haliea sp.]HBM83860.1 UDP-glucose 6-dehydrogenase [Halieaceae bacterium]MAD63247.1 UDP-glucose 6-dehydrogenase [Haliea sp.]MAY94179.1 UDP-glucose 6-dehydrogenase [Haliea sp.]MBK40076.1 UDP-glucose 6-dehydrogenase [Haliea sp.]MBP70093.1 UDP-glucose 6-dehydrogenase [Haliea sp.]|tara:strand:- start:1471 stop:2814 length:1344 start_codon:yes stop_codon:yes gene_type:complete
MNISIFGSGYVGLVQAAIFADVGHKVVCMDIDAGRVDRLREGDVPFYEPGLSQLIRNGISNGLLSFTTDAKEAVQASDFLFICVGTPAGTDGSADLTYVMQVANSIARYMTSRKVIITKSTVPVGTTDTVHRHILQTLHNQGRSIAVEAASNPEFLKEGSAVADCQSPDRIIIGTESPRVLEELRRMYQAFNRNHEKVMHMDPRSAEMTKLAANAMLATKISFMNEMATIAEAVGADIELVRRGMGSDPRIGYQFIYPGCGYGGSCFPKDVRALKHLAEQHGHRAGILTAVHDTNQRQKNKLAERVMERLGADLSGKTIAVWGLSFKPNTDDMREAPSRYLMEGIWSCGGKVRAFDPQAMQACREIYGERDELTLCAHKEDALQGADALVICTEWKAFWSPDFELIKRELSTPLIFDGRNLYNPAQMEELDIEYYGIGRGRSLAKPA